MVQDANEITHLSPKAPNKPLDCYGVSRPRRQHTRTEARGIGRAQEVKITHLEPNPQTARLIERLVKQSTQVEGTKELYKPKVLNSVQE